MRWTITHMTHDMDGAASTDGTHIYGTQAQLISIGDTEYFMIANHNMVNCSIALAGVFANLINIIVFFKLGFDNTINISFFGLSVSDLCSLLAMVWFTICVNPLFVQSDVPMVPPEILHLTAGIPHICFVRITGWITVFVTAERCLCITLPLKIKRIITPKVTTITICFIYALIILSFVPEYQTSYIDWKFYPERNRTLLGLAFTRDRNSMEGLVFFLYSILGTASFVAVIVFTVILIVQLKQKTKWRKKANADKAQSESISTRDRKTVTMVLMIAAVLIVCYTPGVVISMASFFNPEFSVLGSQSNLFYVTWSFAFIFEAFNASVNILLYYRMSTKFREMLNAMFGL